MKRKAKDSQAVGGHSQPPKRLAVSYPPASIKSSFSSDLLSPKTIASFRSAYESSSPYPHAVVPSLIEDALLRRVRDEITSHISFTLKETDIYRIHQSGDLANLSNLDSESLAHLPSLVQLRDALYSHDFRSWISEVTGGGKLSGFKTDMAVNVYTPGSYLLCHDDVIGSRTVSYILYLTDPDDTWQPDWGGSLRLHGTEVRTNKGGERIRVPLAEHTLKIPPAFSQLSFFAVRPGESYHDVEEVYHAKHSKEDKRRIRMAISGWYHIPQEGEDGYEEGAEEAQAQKSSLAQLKGAANEFDEPQVEFRHFDEGRMVVASDAKSKELDPGEDYDQDEDIPTEQDLTFLLEYISPSFLTPDMTEKLSESFEENSFVQLERFLCDKFAEELKEFISSEEAHESSARHSTNSWPTARPPHKHRYQYLQNPQEFETRTPISRLLVDLLRSHAFKKWLALITGLQAASLLRQSAVARRFRRGKDYALASGYRGDQPQIEFTIGLTPTTGWDTADDEQEASARQNGNRLLKKDQTTGHGVKVETSDVVEFGGEELYMAGDDDDESVTLPHVGKKADPAVYKSAGDNEDDGILLTNCAVWNQLSVVLRDKGTLRFVKYVSQAANGDRWDIKGEVELSGDAFEGEEIDLGEDDIDADEEGGEEEGDDEGDEEENEELDPSDDDDDES